MMEPPPAMEEEFQDWYDTEHFPERATCEGFLTVHRFICIDGWPRYLALYDLADTDVLRGPAYARIAGERARRGHIGSYRASGVSIAPTPSRCIPARHSSVMPGRRHASPYGASATLRPPPNR